MTNCLVSVSAHQRRKGCDGGDPPCADPRRPSSLPPYSSCLRESSQVPGPAVGRQGADIVLTKARRSRRGNGLSFFEQKVTKVTKGGTRFRDLPSFPSLSSVETRLGSGWGEIQLLLEGTDAGDDDFEIDQVTLRARFWWSRLRVAGCVQRPAAGTLTTAIPMALANFCWRWSPVTIWSAPLSSAAATWRISSVRQRKRGVYWRASRSARR